jgi:hypothetical protein
MKAARAHAGRRALLIFGPALPAAQPGTPVVLVALQIASFHLRRAPRRLSAGAALEARHAPDAVAGMGVAIALMASLWAAQQFGAMPKVVDTLWFSLLGGS